MIDPQLPGQWKTWARSLTLDNTTRAKILADETPPQVMAAITGETALPGEATVRQRILTGGQRIVDGGFASTDGTARDIKMWMGTVLSRGGASGANPGQSQMGTVSVTTQNVLNRTTGSFLTDGWQVGDDVMMFDTATAANNGVKGAVTVVTATAMTVSGTPWTNDAASGAATRVARVAQRTMKNIPLNAGNTNAAPPVPIMSGAQDPGALPPPDTGISLGSADVFIIAAAANLSALPAQIDAYAVAALY